MPRSPQPLTLVVVSCSVGVFGAISGLKDRLKSIHGESASLFLLVDGDGVASIEMVVIFFFCFVFLSFPPLRWQI